MDDHGYKMETKYTLEQCIVHPEYIFNGQKKSLESILEGSVEEFISSLPLCLKNCPSHCFVHLPVLEKYFIAHMTCFEKILLPLFCELFSLYQKKATPQILSLLILFCPPDIDAALDFIFSSGVDVTTSWPTEAVRKMGPYFGYSEQELLTKIGKRMTSEQWKKFSTCC